MYYASGGEMPPAPFNPASRNPIAWLATDGNVYSDNGVTLAANGEGAFRIDDKSGNGRNASQSTLSDRATYRTNKLNGKPSVEFDVTNDYYSMGGFPSPSALTFYIVLEPKTNSGSDVTFGCVFSQIVSGAATMTPNLFIGGATGLLTGESIALGCGNGTQNKRLGASNANFSFTNGTPLILTVSFGPGGTKMWKNGTAVTLDLSSTANTSEDWSPNALGISDGMAGWLGQYRFSTPGQFLNAHLYEFFVVASEDDADQRAAMHDYLINKWGLA